MDLKAIDKNIVSIRKGGKAFNELVQSTIVGVMRHAKDHGDCTRALTLVLAIPENFKMRAKVIEHFRAYSPIGMNAKEGKVHIRKDQNAPKWNIEGAEANPFYIVQENEREALPDTTFDNFVSMIEAVLDKVSRKVEKNKVAANDADAIKQRVREVRQLMNVAPAKLVAVKAAEKKAA
jgi:hypothetical protein